MSPAQALEHDAGCEACRPAFQARQHGPLVRELLAAQLGLDIADVDVELSFRDLGVDHDDAVVLTTLLHEALGQRLAPPLLFAYRQPARLIAALDGRSRCRGGGACRSRRVTVLTNVPGSRTFSAADRTHGTDTANRCPAGSRGSSTDINEEE